MPDTAMYMYSSYYSDEFDYCGCDLTAMYETVLHVCTCSTVEPRHYGDQQKWSDN